MQGKKPEVKDEGDIIKGKSKRRSRNEELLKQKLWLIYLGNRKEVPHARIM
jgi:hypothetical protein